MDKAAFGEFLASLRNEHNLTQEQVAEKINVNYKTISKWECGNCLPDLDTLVKLAQIYKVSLYELTIEYKRIKNPFISKNNIKKIINKKSKKRFFIINVTAFIFMILAFMFSLCCCVYTINNYNQIQIYEINSTNEDFNIRGIVIKQHDEYCFFINSIEVSKITYANYHINRLQYYISINEINSEVKEISLNSHYALGKIVSNITILSVTSHNIDEIKKLYLNIEFVTNDNVHISKQIKLDVIKTYCNNTL